MCTPWVVFIRLNWWFQPTHLKNMKNISHEPCFSPKVGLNIKKTTWLKGKGFFGCMEKFHVFFVSPRFLMEFLGCFRCDCSDFQTSNVIFSPKNQLGSQSSLVGTGDPKEPDAKNRVKPLFLGGSNR